MEKTTNSYPTASSDRSVSRNCRVPAHLSGLRFDQIAAKLFPEFSRGKLQAWILSGELTINGKPGKPKGKRPFEENKPGKRDPRPPKSAARSGTPKPKAPKTTDTSIVAPKPKTRKGASDPSKPMGDRKARHAGKQGKPPSGKPANVKTRAGKGADARPMRKAPRTPR